MFKFVVDLFREVLRSVFFKMGREESLPKHLPLSTGPYVPGCVDIMNGYTRNSLFARIYYPSNLEDVKSQSSRWMSWLPHAKYVIGFAYVLNLWTFLIKLLMKFIAGDVKFPAVEKADLRSDIGKLRTVVFSHGLGGTRFFYTSICCELASHGYVVIAVEHKDDSASMTYYYENEEKKKLDERKWMKFKRVNVGGPQHHPERKKQVEFRSKECSKALDYLHNLNEGKIQAIVINNDFDFLQFQGRLDFSLPVMIGHSFGGATALLTLGLDPRFRVGVILDPWMFSIKSFNDLPDKIDQPLVIINTQTFHIPINLDVLTKFTDTKSGELVRDTYTIKNTTHENQSDTVHIIGYWLNIFMRKIDPIVASEINNNLILRYLNKHVGFKHAIYSYEYLQTQQEHVVKDITVTGVKNKAKKIPKIW